MHCVRDRAMRAVLHAMIAPLEVADGRLCVAITNEHVTTRALRVARARVGATRVDSWTEGIDFWAKRVTQQANSDDFRLTNVLLRAKRVRLQLITRVCARVGSPLSTTRDRLRVPQVLSSPAKAPASSEHELC